jgi:hypothetical protein
MPHMGTAYDFEDVPVARTPFGWCRHVAALDQAALQSPSNLGIHD